MKKLIITIISALLLSNVNAQEEVKTNYNNQLTFGVLGNTGLFIYKYGFDKKYSKRITLDGSFTQDKSNRSFGPGIKNLRKKTNGSINFGYGFQKNVNLSNKINFFSALDLVVGTSFLENRDGWEVKDSTSYAEFEDSNSWGNFSNNSDGDYHKTSQSSMNHSLGIRPSIGFNIKLIDRLQAGIEYRVSLASLTYLSDYKYKRESFENGIENSNEYKNDPSLQFGSSINGNTAVTLTYSF